MDTFVISFSTLLLGFSLAFWLVASAYEYEESKKLEECEKSLPRTEHCHLIAVPKND